MRKKSYALREKQHIVLAEGLNFSASGGYAQIKAGGQTQFGRELFDGVVQRRFW
jgi:hypothetical protein